MLEYPYRKISQNRKVPEAPCIRVKLVNNEVSPRKEIECDALFDTGSDLTLIPLNLLIEIEKKAYRETRVIERIVKNRDIPNKINEKPELTSERIEGIVKGKGILAIPYKVCLVFDRDRSVEILAMGCAVSEIGELMIIGRDFMNRYCITFDGPNLKFGIDFGQDIASDRI